MQKSGFDVLIIGGGITGAGIALDAASRGLKTALIEKQDFGAGTSSRSTKLIHGGLRYLENLEFNLVREVGIERAIVHKNAPHLVIPMKMILPLTKKGSLNKLTAWLGLTMYDFLAGVNKKERRKMLSKENTLEKEPLLNQEGLLGSALYYEYKTDDARLVMEALKKAHELGSLALNYCSLKKFTYANNKISGIEAYDMVENTSFFIPSKIVINATGPWVDYIRNMDGELSKKQLHITKGIHIIIPRNKLPINNGIYFDTSDGRMIFTIPKKNKIYIGTTDTDYKGNFENPEILTSDVQYLIDATNARFPKANLVIQDVESSWAGLRPLINQIGKSPSELSRKDEIFYSKSGLISIAGGKLTGYRKMAEKIVDIVQKKLQKHGDYPNQKCITQNLPLSGGNFGFYPEILKLVDYADTKYDEVKHTGIALSHFQTLFYRYGTNIDTLIHKAFEYYNEVKEASVSFLRAEIWYSIHFEMTYDLNDFFSRRTEMLYFEKNKIPKFEKIVLREFEQYFGWKTDQKEYYLNKLHKEMNGTLSFQNC